MEQVATYLQSENCNVKNYLPYSKAINTAIIPLDISDSKSYIIRSFFM